MEQIIMDPIAQSARIVVTEADAELRQAFLRLFPDDRLEFHEGLLDLDAATSKDVEALCVTVRSPVGAVEMDRFPSLRIIATGSAGYDHIDLEAARSRGITVCNVSEYGPAVAEFNMALMLALARKIHTAHRHTLAGDFSIHEMLGTNLYGKTLGIIGTGRIGKRLARLARGFGMQVIATDPHPAKAAATLIGYTYLDLDSMLRLADVVAVCCPLTQQTRHLLDRRRLAKLKRGALLVNTSRGAVMDTRALLWALDEGIVEGVALDVLEGEATLAHTGAAGAEDAEQVFDALALLRHPKVLVTPHMAYYTRESLQAIREQTAENVRAFFAGSPVNAVP